MDCRQGSSTLLMFGPLEVLSLPRRVEVRGLNGCTRVSASDVTSVT
jgi:hypothetical protein